MIIKIAPEKSLENMNQRLRNRLIHPSIPGTSIRDVILALNGITVGDEQFVLLYEDDGADALVRVINCIMFEFAQKPMRKITKSLFFIEFPIIIKFSSNVLYIYQE